MTDSTPPPMPGFPPPLPPEPSAPAKKNRTNLVIIGAATAVIAAIIGTGIVVVQATDDDSQRATTTASSAPDEDVVTAAAEEPDPEPTFAEVDSDSFEIKLRTTERQCFGSAGCNVTVEPDMTLLVDSADLDPDAVYEITYEIRGDEDGPVIETAELSDQTSLNFTPSLVSTSSASKKLSVEITDVQVR
ncbi:hypothetical protein [Streptomyces sp. SID12501]|uniref:Uncharacterized protein n=1 Tax=Streptomyces sp. SID12501 TaxID=2706042 RepID=A0A6B3C6B9_9ACTN|nr:hypothetical protein [Streptomyces sp. SID12501]NEC92189.1 hypothetical protein [Streptomyces sp. SID12501]